MTSPSTPRILLFGKGGQVATELTPLLMLLGELRVLGPEDCDFANPAGLAPIIAEYAPNIIVNGAAYTAVDKAESEPELAAAVNAEALAVIGKAARALDALVVHYSTDYVFDGTSSKPYTESDTPNPKSVYGSTKLQGERLLQESGADHMIFRTAWVYSSVGKNFLKTMLKLAAEREELRVVSDQFGSPTHARTIAAGTALALTTWLHAAADRRAALQGVFNLVSSGKCTWCDFTNAIIESARTLTDVRCARVIPIATADYPTPAKRPTFSVLDNSHFCKTFGLHLPDWRPMVPFTVNDLLGAR
jgi:dTDP-4-dehydrorhamnose reductase